MKRFIIFFLLISFITGMTIFAQGTDMSYYTEEFNRIDATFVDRLEVLRTVHDAGTSGISEFYHDALKFLVLKIPDIKTTEDRDAVVSSARILCQALGDDKYTVAAPEIWEIVLFSDVILDVNDGILMQEALVALGQVGDPEYVNHIVLRLNDFNTAETSDVETKRRIQRGVAGSINALEALHDIAGFTPVFFVYVGWYDPAIKSIASAALPNIVEDPGEPIIEIIRNTSNDPAIKYEAWLEMLLTSAPNSSKAKVAAAAFDMGWSYPTSNQHFQRLLREMRKSAIDTIRLYGVEDESVYANFDKSYSSNFSNASPDYDEIKKTIDALAVVKTDEAVNLLLNFLRELHDRRRIGPWTNKERQVFQWVIPALGSTKTQSPDVLGMLTTIQRSQEYTGNEQRWAQEAIRDINNR
jgi:hypothetical protein